MHNDIITIGSFTIHGYGLMVAIGIIAAYIVMHLRAKRKGLDQDHAFWLIIWCLIFGFLGSKILYIITILPQVTEDPSIILSSLLDGWVMYGGLLGGILGGFLYCRWKKLNAWAYFDLGLVSVILAQAFGRLGCFLAGCCYGVETTSPIGITFTHSEFAPNNVCLVPTQLISSIGNFIIFVILLIYDKYKRTEGQVTGMYLMLYSAGRFVLEFFRGDIARGSVGPLSTSQFIAIFTFAAGVIVWMARRKAETAQAAQTEAAIENAEKAAEKSAETVQNKKDTDAEM